MSASSILHLWFVMNIPKLFQCWEPISTCRLTFTTLYLDNTKNILIKFQIQESHNGVPVSARFFYMIHGNEVVLKIDLMENITMSEMQYDYRLSNQRISANNVNEFVVNDGLIYRNLKKLFFRVQTEHSRGIYHCLDIKWKRYQNESDPELQIIKKLNSNDELYIGLPDISNPIFNQPWIFKLTVVDFLKSYFCDQQNQQSNSSLSLEYVNTQESNVKMESMAESHSNGVLKLRATFATIQTMKSVSLDFYLLRKCCKNESCFSFRQKLKITKSVQVTYIEGLDDFQRCSKSQITIKIRTLIHESFKLNLVSQKNSHFGNSWSSESMLRDSLSYGADNQTVKFFTYTLKVNPNDFANTTDSDLQFVIISNIKGKELFRSRDLNLQCMSHENSIVRNAFRFHVLNKESTMKIYFQKIAKTTHDHVLVEFHAPQRLILSIKCQFSKNCSQHKLVKCIKESLSRIACGIEMNKIKFDYAIRIAVSIDGTRFINHPTIEFIPNTKYVKFHDEVFVFNSTSSIFAMKFAYSLMSTKINYLSHILSYERDGKQENVELGSYTQYDKPFIDRDSALSYTYNHVVINESYIRSTSNVKISVILKLHVIFPDLNFAQPVQKTFNYKMTIQRIPKIFVFPLINFSSSKFASNNLDMQIPKSRIFLKSPTCLHRVTIGKDEMFNVFSGSDQVVFASNMNETGHFCMIYMVGCAEMMISKESISKLENFCTKILRLETNNFLTGQC